MSDARRREADVDGSVAVGRAQRLPVAPSMQRPLAFLPAALFLVASLAAAAVALGVGSTAGLWSVLPVGPVAAAPFDDLLAAAALSLTGVLLVRAKRLGFWLALAALSAGFVVQGLEHRHAVAAVVAIAVGGTLVLTRRRYRVGSGAGTAVAVALLASGAGIVAIAGAAAVIRGALDERALIDAVATWIDDGTAHPSTASFAPVALLGAAVSLGRAAQLAALAVGMRAQAWRRSEREVAAGREAIVRHGRGALRPYLDHPTVTTMADGDGSAVLAFARAGRIATVLGDPDGAPDAAVRLLDAWRDRCRASDWLPAIYQASDGWRARLESDGWHGVPIGAEAVIDPTTFDISTPRLANVRHTVTRSRRGGVTVVRVQEGRAGAPPDPRRVRQLLALDRDWRRRAGLRMGFTVGEFDPGRLDDALITAAVDHDDEPVAFIVLRPTGADHGWLLDVMRRAAGSPPGGVEACLVDAIALLAAWDVHRLSLGLAPLAGLRPDSASVAERFLAHAARLIRPLYDVRGLEFYKDKFAPAWEPRFLLVEHAWVLPGALIALIRLHLGGSWRAVMGSVRSRPT